MDKSQPSEYREFEEKVKRTICTDYVSPQASESVLKEAFNQFGTVRSICFILNYLGPTNRGKSVLIEMNDVKQATDVISTINQFPFMIYGMPRPVQARAAEKEMFVDRPAKPGKKIKCCWLEPNDPDFKVATKLKLLAKKQTEEAAYLLKVTQNPTSTYIQILFHCHSFCNTGFYSFSETTTRRREDCCTANSQFKVPLQEI